jgi:hypothetical protein
VYVISYQMELLQQRRSSLCKVVTLQQSRQAIPSVTTLVLLLLHFYVTALYQFNVLQVRFSHVTDDVVSAEYTAELPAHNTSGNCGSLYCFRIHVGCQKSVCLEVTTPGYSVACTQWTVYGWAVMMLLKFPPQTAVRRRAAAMAPLAAPLALVASIALIAPSTAFVPSFSSKQSRCTTRRLAIRPLAAEKQPSHEELTQAVQSLQSQVAALTEMMKEIAIQQPAKAPVSKVNGAAVNGAAVPLKTQTIKTGGIAGTAATASGEQLVP